MCAPKSFVSFLFLYYIFCKFFSLFVCLRMVNKISLSFPKFLVLSKVLLILPLKCCSIDLVLVYMVFQVILLQFFAFLISFTVFIVYSLFFWKLVVKWFADLFDSLFVFLMNYLAPLFSMSVFSFSFVYLSDLFFSLTWVFLKTEFLFINFCLCAYLQLCTSHYNVFHVSISFF